jgi:hypothetical protein
MNKNTHLVSQQPINIPRWHQQLTDTHFLIGHPSTGATKLPGRTLLPTFTRETSVPTKPTDADGDIATICCIMTEGACTHYRHLIKELM